jgi:hypothetical protein
MKLSIPLIALAVASVPAASHAQLAPYSVEVDSATYAGLSGASTHTFRAFGPFPASDEGRLTLALPFIFNFYGEDYDEVIVYTNGVVAFESAAAGTSILRPASRVPRAGDDLDAFISGVWQDLEFRSGISELRSQTLGTAPSRTFVIEYSNFARKGQPNDRITFRIELDEEDFTVRVWFGAVSGIFGSTTAIEGELGRDGLNLLESSASCTGTCPCAPVSCGNANYISGRRITASLPDAPDLYGTVDAPAGASPGSSFDVTLRIENGGLLDAGPSSYELWLAANPNDLNGATRLASGSVPPVSAVDRIEIQRSVLLPVGTVVGRRYLAVVVDPDDDVVEADEANNTNVDRAFGTGPDLTGEVTAPFVIGPGEPVAIDVQARSDGAPTTAPFTVTFFLSSDPVIDASDLSIGQTTGNLGPGGFAATISAQPPLPGSIPFTSAYLLARLDALNVIAEIDEGNNDVATALPLQIETADLQIPFLVARGALFPAQPAEVEVQVENGGAARASDFSVCLYLTTSQASDPPSADLVLEVDGLTLLPEERVTLRLQPVVPSGTIGDVFLTAEVDCLDAIDEASEINNVRARSVTVFPSGPDLSVAWTSTAGPAQAGQTYPVVLQLDNVGSEAATAQVDLVLRGPEGITVVPLFEDPVALDVQGGRTFAVEPRLPSDLTSAVYTATLEARVVQGGADPFASNDVAGPFDVPVSSFGVAFVARRPASATLGQPYRWRFSAVGGDGEYAWSLQWTGAESPPGIQFDPATATLTGEPEVIGSFPFRLSVSSAGLTNETSAALTVVPPSLPLTITTRSMPPAVVGEFYSEVIIVLGGTPPYRFESGDAPLTLQATGRLVGEPPFATATFFEVCVTDARNDQTCATVAFSAIDAADVIEIGLADLPNGLVDRPYAINIPVIDAEPPVQLALEGDLPPGLAFDAAQGRLAGTPEVAGTYPVIIEARDAAGRFDRNPFVLVILESGALQIATERYSPTAD